MGPSLLINGYRRMFHRVQSGRGVGLTIRLHLVPRLRVGGVILPVPLYAFLTWSGTTLLFTYISREMDTSKLSSNDRICGQAYRILNFVNYILWMKGLTVIEWKAILWAGSCEGNKYRRRRLILKPTIPSSAERLWETEIPFSDRGQEIMTQ
jgi:hypothetical protein